MKCCVKSNNIKKLNIKVTTDLKSIKDKLEIENLKNVDITYIIKLYMIQNKTPLKIIKNEDDIFNLDEFAVIDSINLFNNNVTLNIREKSYYSKLYSLDTGKEILQMFKYKELIRIETLSHKYVFENKNPDIIFMLNVIRDQGIFLNIEFNANIYFEENILDYLVQNKFLLDYNNIFINNINIAINNLNIK